MTGSLGIVRQRVKSPELGQESALLLPATLRSHLEKAAWPGTAWRRLLTNQEPGLAARQGRQAAANRRL